MLQAPLRHAKQVSLNRAGEHEVRTVMPKVSIAKRLRAIQRELWPIRIIPERLESRLYGILVHQFEHPDDVIVQVAVRRVTRKDVVQYLSVMRMRTVLE